MNLKTYLEERGGGQQLASAVGVSAVIISQWKTGARQVPAERCPAIERATAGAVTCEQLRPDVDWAYLRNSTTAPVAAESLEPGIPTTGEPALACAKVPARRVADRRDRERRHPPIDSPQPVQAALDLDGGVPTDHHDEAA